MISKSPDGNTVVDVLADMVLILDALSSRLLAAEKEIAELKRRVN